MDIARSRAARKIETEPRTALRGDKCQCRRRKRRCYHDRLPTAERKRGDQYQCEPMDGTATIGFRDSAMLTLISLVISGRRHLRVSYYLHFCPMLSDLVEHLMVVSRRLLLLLVVIAVRFPSFYDGSGQKSCDREVSGNRCSIFSRRDKILKTCKK